tara:strand:+ start:294 stop:3404 length:3111 start_codon:yes stop_codon:yes gene_type:complete
MKKWYLIVYALAVMATISANAASSDASRHVTFEDKQIPVIKRTDVLLVGSSLDACFLASTFAKEGQRVVLAAAGTSLPHELIMCQRPWVKRSWLDSSDVKIKAFLSGCVDREVGDDSLLDMIKVTEGLEDLLLDSGASLHYDLFPCGVAQTDRVVTAVVFACKGGLVAVEADTVIDCTADALIVTLAGGETKARASAQNGVLARYSYLCKEERSAPIAVKDVPELVNGQVVMHGPYAEFRLRLPVPESSFPEAVYNQDARRIVMRASRGTDLQYARGGNTMLMDPARRIVSRSKTGTLTLDACRPEKLDNVWVCGPMVDVEDELALSMVEPLASSSFVPLLKDVVKEPTEALKTVGVLQLGESSAKTTSGSASFEAVDPIYTTGNYITAQAGTLPVVAKCELVVVGAGTSGMPAALVASRQGVDTIVVEKFGDVGGTHTIGGVCKYWFGRETDFVRQLDREAEQTMQTTGMPKCMGMLDNLMRAGTRILTHTLAVGAVVDGQRLTGIVVTTPNGLGVIQAKYVIDATGDADIVARAGGAFTYGPVRDAMTLFYSFGQFIGVNPEAKRHFAFVVDFRDPTDLSRALIASRRFKKAVRKGESEKGRFPQYYMTPRQSRNIQASVRVTYADIMSGRRFEDMIAVCNADVDLKGIADSDLSFCGYVTNWMQKFSVQIPYRALRPVEFDNVLVVGKAMSVDHDTLALARMQRDLMAIGGAAGLAVAQSVISNQSLSNVDIKALQKGLIRLGALSVKDLSTLPGVNDSALPEIDSAQLKQMAEQLAAGNLKLMDKVSLLMRPKLSVPLLKEAAGNATGSGRIEVGKALSFLGDRQGAAILLSELKQSLQTPGLSTKTHVKMHHETPDHASAPEITYWVNSLGRSGDSRVIPLMTEIARRVEMNPNKSDAMFNYVYSICYAADRLADPACIEVLSLLAKKSGIAGSLHTIGTDPRETGKGKASIREDRYAYLELCIGRALARCGSKQGYQTVIDYLTDIRGFLARSAHEELAALSGHDFSYDTEAWSHWLEEATVSPIQYTGR